MDTKLDFLKYANLLVKAYVLLILIALSLLIANNSLFIKQSFNSINYFGTPNVDTSGAKYNGNDTWLLKNGKIWDGK